MGKRDASPDPLERARGGDEAALEQVLGGICAPLFDLALHLLQQPVRAELATVEALRDLASDIRSGGPAHGDPLAAAARHLIRQGAEDPAPPAPGGLRSRLAALAPGDRLAVVCAFALDIGPEALAFVLDVDLEEAARARTRALEQLEIRPSDLRRELDALAADTRLPFGLIDRATA